MGPSDWEKHQTFKFSRPVDLRIKKSHFLRLLENSYYLRMSIFLQLPIDLKEVKHIMCFNTKIYTLFTFHQETQFLKPQLKQNFT